MITLSPSALGRLTSNSNPTCPTQFILPQCLWDLHWLLPIAPAETKDLPFLSVPSPIHHQLLPSIFFSNLYTFPHFITVLSKPPHLWPGLFLTDSLSSALPSLQSFLHVLCGVFLKYTSHQLLLTVTTLL